MKKIYRFEFNEGVDGIVIAKSFKQAAKKIAKEYDTYSYMEIMVECSNEYVEGIDFKGSWSVDCYKVPKKKKYSKSKVIGWIVS